MDIFADKQLHPGYRNPIKQYYKDYFDTVFVAFSPFFKLKSGKYSQEGSQKSKQITFEQAQATIEIFQKMPKPAAKIYSYENENYPNDEEIYLNGEEVLWRDVKDGCVFESNADICKALKTSIGGYKKVFQRPDLAKRLSNFTTANQIYYPIEGHFEILSKKEIFKAFQLLNKTELVIEEEFCQNRREVNIAYLTEKNFVEVVNFKDYFIYDSQKELLFAVDWDDFFFLICSNNQNIKRIINTLSFEGFYCDDITEIPWELEKEEIEAGIQKEQQQKEIEQANQAAVKKPWWKLW